MKVSDFFYRKTAHFLIFGHSPLYTLKKENEVASMVEDSEPYRNLKMVVGKDLEEENARKSETESEFNSSRTSFRITSRKGRRKGSVIASRNRSGKRIVPSKGAKLGKIRLKGQSSRNLIKPKRKPPVDLAGHFMKKFNPSSSDLQKIQPKKAKQKFFTIPFQIFNIVVNEDSDRFETVLPTLENILVRWKAKLEKRILIQSIDTDNTGVLIKAKRVELESIISEKNEKKFQDFFDGLSKRKELNRSCFALYKLFKDTERVKVAVDAIAKEPKKYLIFFNNFSKISKGVKNSIDRMTLSSAYKQLLAVFKSELDTLKENEYLNYLFLESFLASSSKIIELFMMSKLQIGLILSKKNHDLLRKHCNYWAKVVKSNLLNMANLQKNFEIKFFKDYYKEKLKKPKSTLVKITEFCNIVLRVLEFLEQDKDAIKLGIKEIRQIITGVPKGLNLLEEKNVVLWDTIVVSGV